MSVIVILFWGNQKNIGVGLSGRNNADFWFVYKKFERFPDYQGAKRNFSSRTDVFLKSQLRCTLNLARFDTKFVALRKTLLSALWQGILGGSV